MGQLKCKKVKLWHCIPCRLTLVCISSENSTNYEKCWLILTGLPSLLLNPISCWLVSSAVRCRLPTALLRRPLPTDFSEFLCPTPHWRSLAYFWSCRDLKSKPFVWFRAKTKGSSAWQTTNIVSQYGFKYPYLILIIIRCQVIISI